MRSPPGRSHPKPRAIRGTGNLITDRNLRPFPGDHVQDTGVHLARESNTTDGNP
ncbi:hypothetical protein [Sporichthya sp.]|uniref:hypothetical protein n=1 Tax=Sporichthya sp. TaxID=65475 RepID=UPI00179BCD4D|nr:hypothetical protein [Sporichthya sp.]MBA3743206.1 hypothetical protein [Sporichthya sp.]